jgi:4'-phosphopantetheinyl transferase
MVVCVIAHGFEVGVDLEPYKRAEEIARPSETVSSPLKLAQLDTLNGSEKADRALSLWTLKESYIKARGVGLSLPLSKISFLFGGREGIRLELDACLDDEAERWRFCLLGYAGHLIALTGERVVDFELQLFEARPPAAAAARVARETECWYPRRSEGPDTTDPPMRERRR